MPCACVTRWHQHPERKLGCRDERGHLLPSEGFFIKKVDIRSFSYHACDEILGSALLLNDPSPWVLDGRQSTYGPGYIWFIFNVDHQTNGEISSGNFQPSHYLEMRHLGRPSVAHRPLLVALQRMPSLPTRSSESHTCESWHSSIAKDWPRHKTPEAAVAGRQAREMLTVTTRV